MRSIINRVLPTSGAVPATPGALAQQALDLPQLLPIRLFWNSFREMRPWWPVLIPLLLLSGLRAYRRERARVLAARSK